MCFWVLHKIAYNVWLCWRGLEGWALGDEWVISGEIWMKTHYPRLPPVFSPCSRIMLLPYRSAYLTSEGIERESVKHWIPFVKRKIAFAIAVIPFFPVIRGRNAISSEIQFLTNSPGLGILFTLRSPLYPLPSFLFLSVFPVTVSFLSLSILYSLFSFSVLVPLPTLCSNSQTLFSPNPCYSFMFLFRVFLVL